MALQPFKGKFHGHFSFTFTFECFKLIFGFFCYIHVSQVILASHEDRYEAQHQAVVVISTLIEFDENWIADQTDLIATLKSIWETDLYKVR